MLIFFIIAEMIVLTNIMQPLFKKHIGFLMKEDTNFSIAAIFYFVYVAGVFWFATRAGIKSESYLVAIFSGAFLGLLNPANISPWYLILPDGSLVNLPLAIC